MTVVDIDPSGEIRLPSNAEMLATPLPVERRFRYHRNGIPAVVVYRYPSEAVADSHLRAEQRLCAMRARPRPRR